MAEKVKKRIITNPDMWGYAGLRVGRPYWVIKSLVWEGDICTGVLKDSVEFFLDEVSGFILVTRLGECSVTIELTDGDISVCGIGHSHKGKSIIDALYHDLPALAFTGMSPNWVLGNKKSL